MYFGNGKIRFGFHLSCTQETILRLFDLLSMGLLVHQIHRRRPYCWIRELSLGVYLLPSKQFGLNHIRFQEHELVAWTPHDRTL